MKKSRLLKSLLGILFFLMIFLCCLNLLRPVYREIDARFRNLESLYRTEFSEATGLSLSYDSLSPSFLTGITINNIHVFDVESGEDLLFIKRLSFNYNLISLIHKDFDNLFRSLVVSGVTGNFDKQKLLFVKNKLRERKTKNSDELASEAPVGDKPSSTVGNIRFDEEHLISEEQKSLIKKIFSSIPQKTYLKDVQVLYSAGKTTLAFSLNKLTLLKVSDKNITLESDSGSIFSEFGAKKTSAGVRFAIKGNIVPVFSGSSAILTLNPYLTADYTVYSSQFLLRYEDSSVFLRSTQLSLPYSIYTSFRIPSRELDATIDFNSLNLLSLVKIPFKNKKVEKLAQTLITLHGNGKADLRNKTYSWNGDGSFDLSEDFIKGGETVTLKASGNEKLLKIDSLAASGKMLTASLTGKVDFVSKTPDCTLRLDSFVLPNGNVLSFKAFFETDGRNILVSLPSVSLGKAVVSGIKVNAAVEKDSIPFSIALSNSAHASYGLSSIRGSGNFCWKKDRRSLQFSADVSNFFLDTILHCAAFFLKADKADKIQKYIPRLSSYVTDDSFSFSTNFKSCEFSIPAFSIKDSKKNGRQLVAAVKGSDRSLDVQKFSLNYGILRLNAILRANLAPESKELTFTSSMNVNDVPYDFTGTFAKGKWFTLSGSYGINILANLEDGAFGSAKISSFPISFSKYKFNFSFDSDFDARSLEDFLVNVKTFQIEELEGKLNRSPKISLVGSVDQEGFIIDSVSYADINSSTDGSGYILWNLNNGILDSASVSIDMANEFTKETFTLDGEFSNPLHAKLTKDVLLKDCYFTLNSDIRGFPLMRFVPRQYADDTFNGSFSASGTVENPYLAVKLENFSAQVGTKPMVINGSAELLEGDLFVPDFDLNWGNISISDFTTDIDLSTFSGTASGELSIKVLGSRYIRVPANLTIRDASDVVEKHSFIEHFIPKKIAIEASSDVTAQGIINGSVPVRCEMSVEGKNIYFDSDDYLGVSGSYLAKTGDLDVRVRKDKPLHGNIGGRIKKSMMNVTIQDFSCDFEKFHELLSTDYLGVYRGLASGYLNISGMTSDPSLDGSLLIRQTDITLPLVFRDHITAKNLLLTLTNKAVEISSCRFLVGNSRMDASMQMYMDRWGLQSVNITGKTVGSDTVYVDMSVPLADLKGETTLNAVMHFEDSLMSLDVTTSLSKGEINVITPLNDVAPIGKLITLSGGKVRKPADKNKPSLYQSLLQTMDFSIKVHAVIDKKVDLVIAPLLQAIVAPGTKVEFALDSASSKWSLKSDAAFRGGHITYLSRNFYIREGSITLNESEKSFNPFITARAETKERDFDGVIVTVVLSAENLSLSNFFPRVYSIPARTEAEIRAMLGQIVSGDSNSAGSLFLTGLDYGMQMTTFKKMENSLRDLMNFDIFSLRVNLLKNSLDYGMSSAKKDYNGTFRSSGNVLGNFFDNTSVYIGKYFGDTVYADALFQFTYETNTDREESAGIFGSGIVFRPEIGIEFEAPFANIRWNFAPDLESLRYGNPPSIVDGTSITLSWRFTF